MIQIPVQVPTAWPEEALRKSVLNSSLLRRELHAGGGGLQFETILCATGRVCDVEGQKHQNYIQQQHTSTLAGAGMGGGVWLP